MSKLTVKEHLASFHKAAAEHHESMAEHHDTLSGHIAKAAGTATGGDVSSCLKGMADEHRHMADFHSKCMQECEKVFEADELEKTNAIADLFEKALAKSASDRVVITPVSGVAPPRVIPRNGQPQSPQTAQNPVIAKVFGMRPEDLHSDEGMAR
jgi:hypothetical protein